MPELVSDLLASTQNPYLIMISIFFGILLSSIPFFSSNFKRYNQAGTKERNLTLKMFALEVEALERSIAEDRVSSSAPADSIEAWEYCLFDLKMEEREYALKIHKRLRVILLPIYYALIVFNPLLVAVALVGVYEFLSLGTIELAFGWFFVLIFLSFTIYKVTNSIDDIVNTYKIDKRTKVE